MPDRDLIPEGIIGHHVAHKPVGKPYAMGCTEDAIRRAAGHFAGIDLDTTINADQTAVGNHWDLYLDRDRWRDTAGILTPGHRHSIRHATDADCARMRYNGQPMLTSVQQAVICREVNEVPCFEAKFDTGRDLVYSVDWWAKFLADIHAVGVVPIVMALPSGGKGVKKLRAAHDAGAVTMWLWRAGSSAPPFVDLVKSHRGRPIYRVSDTPVGPWRIPLPTPVTPEAPVNRLPADLPARLRAAGLKVTEHDGWQTRGRPASTGGFAPVGVLCHHTATTKATSDAATVRLLIGGRSDLPGPLCHLGLGRDGTVHIIASGRANHAGKAKASGSVAAGDGNVLYIGIEAFNDGVGEKWPDVQYDAYVKLAAALCRLTGNSAATVRGHKETSVTGKIDPTFDMGAFRTRVTDVLAAPSPPNRQEPKMNHVEKAVEHFKAGLAELALVADTRTAVQTMEAEIGAALKKGPKS